jgi:hypothetical protein
MSVWAVKNLFDQAANRASSKAWKELCDNMVCCDMAKGHDITVRYRTQMIDGELKITPISDEEYYK